MRCRWRALARGDIVTRPARQRLARALAAGDNREVSATPGAPALFDPRRHESLVAEPWDPGRARHAIETIAAETLAAGRDGRWPRHPLDADAPEAARSLYYGAAGTVWALAHLARAGAIADDPRIAESAAALAAGGSAVPSDVASAPASYFVGATGVLLVALREDRGRGRAAGVADRLQELLRGHLDHPSREAFLGSSGAMVAAAFAWELTGEERWRELYRTAAAASIAAWERHPADGSDLWTQDLYGARRRLLGASHGFAGNVHALCRGLAQLDEATRKAIVTRATEALRGTAVGDGELANWPITAGGATCLAQWCHGAPGVVTSFAGAPPHAELDDTLRRGGELVWRAGPLRKGASLCHGTAGNGEAFLVLFTRTGDELWLARARRFAMHAIHQVETARAAHGRGRYGLWTGDPGVAVYLWQCVAGRSGMPGLDF